MSVNKKIYVYFFLQRIKTKPVVFVCGFVFWTSVFASCGFSTEQKEGKQPASEIENSLATPDASNDTPTETFWTDYDFRNTALLEDASLSEQKFVDFIDYLAVLEKTEATHAIYAMLDSASVEPASFQYFANLYRHYLHDPNSPFRSDARYEAVLDYMRGAKNLSDTEREDYQKQYEKLQKNKPGELSGDFAFVNSFGAAQSFHGVRSPYKLLVFYDPDCETCASVIGEIKESDVLNRMQNDKKLHIVAIMPWNDSALWREHQSQIPKKWTNGFDRGTDILEDDIYDIPAFPTLYLVDKTNKVLIKDGDFLDIERFFDRL